VVVNEIPIMGFHSADADSIQSVINTARIDNFGSSELIEIYHQPKGPLSSS